MTIIIIIILSTIFFYPALQDNFKHIDYEIPIQLINLARQVNVPHCCIVTAKQSDFLPGSWFLYLRTKKEFEKSVGDLKFNHTSIFRPGVLERGEVARLHEKILGINTIYYYINLIIASQFLQ